MTGFWKRVAGLFRGSETQPESEGLARPSRGSAVNTGGGAYIGGSVNVGGEFVGRDQLRVIGDGTVTTWNDGILVQNLNVLVADSTSAFLAALRDPLRAASLQRATEAYLRWLVERYRYLDLRGMGVSDRVPLRLPLLDLYVPLKARQQLPEGESAKEFLYVAGRAVSEEDKRIRGGLSEPRSILDLLRGHGGLIVLGDPGGGKTTFLKFLALTLAVGKAETVAIGQRLPILVPVSAYATRLAKEDLGLDAFIADHFRDIGLDLPIGDLLREALAQGAALVLLDGLDEVKNLGARHHLVNRLHDFYARHGQAGNKFVITSRIVGYREAPLVADGLAECTLVDFTAEEIDAFVGKWTIALEQQASGDTGIARSDAERERQDLATAIRRNPGVQHLAANPLLLTILALMKRQGVRLPERRVELYAKYVEVLLSTWNRARSLDRPAARDVDPVATLRLLAPLALWMHEASPGIGLVKLEALQAKLEQLYENRGDQDPKGSSRRFLEDVREYAGLLLDRGPGEYGFIHLTFEEYLAAVGVAQLGQREVGPLVEYLEARVGQAAWREVSILTVAYLGLLQQREEAAGEVVEALAESTAGEPGAAAVLAGEAVADAGPGVVPAKSKDKLIASLVRVMQVASIAPALRREAGLVLGRLGWSLPDLDEFIEVPAEEFLYGESKEPRAIRKPYRIGKYPVTNAQYGRFVQAGGYAGERYWSEEGWSWRTGSYDSQAQQDWMKDWLARRPPERRTEPYFWRDPVRAAPLCPVVGISWFEAEAYCNWLTQELRTSGALGLDEVARLATELEWERAARGTDGREYPWEGEFQATFANTSESELGGTTAVCTYPQGASPSGAWDMSGNVWEWTLVSWQNDGSDRVARGGSWIGDHRFARCACRFRLIPDDFGSDLGFRVVLSLANSES